jgi:glycyl-tRNA synthetase beta chain
VPVIDKFFENVLVMDNDENIKENRLALLSSIKKKFDKIADFGKLVV